jgi:hypothetical protein
VLPGCSARQQGERLRAAAAGLGVLLQGACQRPEDLLGGMLVAPLLEPDVILGADPCQQRHLRPRRGGLLSCRHAAGEAGVHELHGHGALADRGRASFR